ncbi:MAG: ribose-5-phosphate isomerase RpiA [Myxococcales bacterium]|nr:ribose-5-phosphate isomerase RpiA [Myxococcales bacterium]
MAHQPDALAVATQNRADEEKRRVALAAAALVSDGMVVGLGSGSTAALAVGAIGQRIRDFGLHIVGVSTSSATSQLAIREGIPLVTTTVPTRVDLTIDGADEVDPAMRLIKGGGGCLLREKIVASVSTRLVIVVDSRKWVGHLGETFALPVEVVPLAWPVVQDRLARLGGDVRLRLAKGGGSQAGPFVTDEGNYILDVSLGPMLHPEELGAQISQIPGVVEHGMFLNMATDVITARGEEIEHIQRETITGVTGTTVI